MPPDTLLELPLPEEPGAPGIGPCPHAACRRSLFNAAPTTALDLRGALQKGTITTVFQPIVAFADRKVHCFEALARWEHPLHGFISPAVFVDLAERSGLICELGRIVVDQALLVASEWPEDVMLSVNVSVAQLSNRRLPWEIATALECAAVAPNRLQLELTETMRLDEDHVEVVAQLREQGIRIALDDFGIGHSSFERMRAIPFDTIKLDRSFAQHIGRSPGGQAIVRSLVDLAKTLNATIVAEGIETEADWRSMAATGCNSAQGFWVARPMSELHLATWQASAQVT